MHMGKSVIPVNRKRIASPLCRELGSRLGIPPWKRRQIIGLRPPKLMLCGKLRKLRLSPATFCFGGAEVTESRRTHANAIGIATGASVLIPAALGTIPIGGHVSTVSGTCVLKIHKTVARRPFLTRKRIALVAVFLRPDKPAACD